MSTAFDSGDETIISACGDGPRHRLRLLWVGPGEPSWVGLALRLDAAGYREPHLCWASDAAAALAALRDENFDCVLVDDLAEGERSAPAEFPVPLLQALRGSGYGDSTIYVTPHVTDELRARLYALDCDVLVTPNSYDSPALLPLIQRTVAGAERVRENHRLSIVQQRRLARERDEAEHLLLQQRRIISTLDGGIMEDSLPNRQPSPESGLGETARHAAGTRAELPREANEFYHELLRTYVIMGSGSMTSEIESLARLLAEAGVGPQQALEFHLERVEALVGDLGSRSARHVMARADLLALELMVHLGESYRQLAGSASSLAASTCL